MGIQASMKKLFLGAIVAIGASAVLAAPASADPTCSYVVAGNGTFSVALDATAASAKVTITRDPANPANLIAQNASGAIIGPCTGVQATVTNTETIEVVDPLAGHNAIVAINEQNGEFAPGSNVPADSGSPEINTTINFGGAAGGTSDQLLVDSTDNADNILLGESAAGDVGVNLNAAETVPDVDITASGAEKADINGRKGDDTVSAIGAPAIPAMANPLTLDELILEGGNQNDQLRGGAGNDKLLGGTQDDDLNGGGGNDSLDGGSEDDSLDGGVGADSMIGNTGVDFATYADQTGPVNITLDGLANDGGVPDSFADNVSTDVENVKGGSGADTITGSTLDNELTGNAGNDTLDGGAGNDKISGSAGDDRLLGNVGNDKIFGGDGRDNMVGASGNDKITGNAGVDFFLGKKGFDRLIAKDGTRDKKIDCGPGNNKHESDTRDHKDPKPKSC
jgi:Ca2+-binding RTX toxin-like protein